MQTDRAHSLPCVFLMVMVLAGCIQATSAAPTPVSSTRPEWEKYFQAVNVKGAFVLYDLNRNQTIRYNPERCATRFIPASTFKIMNALIGLETGIIPDADYVIPWDGTRYDIPNWNQDHTLRTAMQNSVVWYYQELARRVGKEKMQHYIDEAGYGNRDISGAIDSFWLDGGLRISPDEQIDFLKRLYQGNLPFSKRTMDIVKEMLVLEKTQAYTLSVKTGWAQRVNLQVGWWVGYVEIQGDVYFFANNFESSAPDARFGPAREEITRAILRELGLIK
jgi:beta-lactamase class D